MEHNFSSHDVCKERGKKEAGRGGVASPTVRIKRDKK